MSDALQKHTLNLRSGDWDYLESIFKPNGIATAIVVRTLVSNLVDKKKDAATTNENVSSIDVEL